MSDFTDYSNSKYNKYNLSDGQIEKYFFDAEDEINGHYVFTANTYEGLMDNKKFMIDKIVEIANIYYEAKEFIRQRKVNVVSKNEEEYYWISYIEHEFSKNENLYFEIQIDNYDNVFFENDVVFINGKKLNEINRIQLLKYIKKYFNTKFTGIQYFISARSQNSLNYWLVISMMQQAQARIESPTTNTNTKSESESESKKTVDNLLDINQ